MVLPTLNLPAALVRIWNAPGHSPHEVVAELAGMPGFVQLDDGLVAVPPVAGRTSVLDIAVRWSRELQRRLAAGGWSAAAAMMIFPGELVEAAGELRPVADFLLRDLESGRPEALTGGIFLSGYAATWLRGRYRLEKAAPHRGPSGRQVPIFRLAGENPAALPWHHPEVLGRRIAVERRSVNAALRVAAGDPHGFRVRGALGVGKSHAVWHFLAARREPTIWIEAGRALPGIPLLARRLAAKTAALAGEEEVGEDDLEGDPQRLVEALAAALRRAADRLGARPRVVLDGMQTILAEDLDLLDRLLAEPRLVEACRWVLIRRTGREAPPAGERLPEVEVPAMDDEELAEIRRQLFAGLGMSDETTSSWIAAAAGNPLVLEEILLDLVHRGHIRRVYGSFFFDGGGDVTYEPSPRWIGQVEAEARRLGEPLPLRILAVSELAVPPLQLERAATELGVELDAGWQRPFLAAGWLRETESAWGPGWTFAGPILGRALRKTLADASVGPLRHTLGQVIAANSGSPTGSWQTYRLLAGSPEALPPLLDFSRSGVDHPRRDDLFEALWMELHEHRERGGDAASELDILWTLLPLGHRLGRLRELEPELARALELAGSQPRRQAALWTLQAELDQEQGRFQQAEGGFRRALAASEGIDDQRRAAIFIRLGELLIRQQSLDEARELFENLLTVVERTDPAISATCHFHLGNVALQQRRLQPALDHHQQACRIRREHRLAKPLGASLSALGSVEVTLGDFPHALGYYREAEEVLAELGSGAELTAARRGVGRALGLLGDHLAASMHLRRALEGCRGRDLIGEAAVRLDLVANQLELGNVEQALEDVRQAHFQLSLAPESRQLGDAEQFLGRVLARQDPRAAGEHFAEARRLHLRHGDTAGAAVDVSLLLGLAVEDGDAKAVRACFHELEELLVEPHPIFGDLLYYRLYKAAEWLDDQALSAEDLSAEDLSAEDLSAKPADYLRRAFQDLVRKTDFLTPELRHGFLFQIREHRELVNAATRHNLTFPGT